MIHVLPVNSGLATANMLEDWLMLEAYPHKNVVRLRHYDWLNPSYTFGVGQPYDWVTQQVDMKRFSLCRRPTGGGLVDHRKDWTYSLVIPCKHPLCHAPAKASYRWVHLCLQSAFKHFGVASKLAPNEASQSHRALLAPTLQCFTRAEPQDLVDEKTGNKLAGAAQKRNREGLLIQGSVHIQGLSRSTFLDVFTQSVASSLELKTEKVLWPLWDPSTFASLQGKLDSQSWQQKR